MQRWTRIGSFALTDDPFDKEVLRGSAAQAMLGLIQESHLDAQDLRRFLWELGHFGIERMNQHQVLATLEHCLSTGSVGVLPWARMQEVLFTPRSSEVRAEGDAGAGGGDTPRATSKSIGQPATPPSRPPPKNQPTPVMARATEAPKQEPPKARGVSPKPVMLRSLAEAQVQLAARREEIALNGYRPKYTDQQLLTMAQLGNVGGERFQVRFMDKNYLQHRNTPTVPLSGAMGATLEGVTGKGAKYWSTSFDQIEDADTDPRLICEKLGIEYKLEAEYVLIVVDTQKAAPLTGVTSIAATFEKVGEFAYTERPQNFTKAFTDEVMTPKFQDKYAKHYQDAVTSGKLDEWKPDADKFEQYLKTADLPADEIKTLKQRMEMHRIIGNNQDYVGNGVTKDLIDESPNSFGAVETFNFERNDVNLQTLQNSGAITILKTAPILEKSR